MIPIQCISTEEKGWRRILRTIDARDLVYLAGFDEEREWEWNGRTDGDVPPCVETRGGVVGCDAVVGDVSGRGRVYYPWDRRSQLTRRLDFLFLSIVSGLKGFFHFSNLSIPARCIVLLRGISCRQCIRFLPR